MSNNITHGLPPTGAQRYPNGSTRARQNNASSPIMSHGAFTPGQRRRQPRRHTVTPHSLIPFQSRWDPILHSGAGRGSVGREAADTHDARQPFGDIDDVADAHNDFEYGAWVHDEPETSTFSPATSGLPSMLRQSVEGAGTAATAPAATMDGSRVHDIPDGHNIYGYTRDCPGSCNANEGGMTMLPGFDSDGPAPMFHDSDPDGTYPCSVVQQSAAGSAYPILDHKVDDGIYQPHQAFTAREAVFGAEELSRADYVDFEGLPQLASLLDSEQQVLGSHGAVNDVNALYYMTQRSDVDLSQLSSHRSDLTMNQKTAQHDGQFQQVGGHSTPLPLMQNRPFNSSGYFGGCSYPQHQDQPYQSIENQDLLHQRCVDCGATDTLQHATCNFNPVTKTSWFIRVGTNEQHTQVHDYLPIFPRNTTYTTQAISPPFQEPRTPFSLVNSDTISARASSQRGPSRSVTVRQPSVLRRGGTGKKFQCVDCVEKGSSRWYVETASTGADRCRRCFDKWEKKQNEHNPPEYKYDPDMATYEVARDKIYGNFKALALRRTDDRVDDWHFFVDKEAEWVSRFIAAAVRPFDHGGIDGLDADQNNETTYKWLQDQQIAFNRAQHEKTGGHWYTNDHVNVRFVMLFYAIINLHRGGPRPYPQGGSNSGYGKLDDSLPCSERLALVEKILGTDKRIVMNVIEGAHVCVLAENPVNVQKRKSSNKNTNLKKAGLTALGKKAAEEAEAREREMAGLEAVDEEDEDASVGFGEQGYGDMSGKGKKRSRAG